MVYGGFMVVQGFFIKLNQIGWYWRWMHYIGLHSYSFSGFMYNEFHGRTFAADPDFPGGGTPEVSGDNVLRSCKEPSTNKRGEKAICLGTSRALQTSPSLSGVLGVRGPHPSQHHAVPLARLLCSGSPARATGLVALCLSLPPCRRFRGHQEVAEHGGLGGDGRRLPHARLRPHGLQTHGPPLGSPEYVPGWRMPLSHAASVPWPLRLCHHVCACTSSCGAMARTSRCRHRR